MNISNHALERYAERVIGKEDNIQTYVAEHKDKIINDINTLLSHSDQIYEGPTLKSKHMKVFVKDTWIFLLDPAKDTLVTLYRINLGAGSDFDNQYMIIMLDKLSQAQSELSQKSSEISDFCKEYKSIIDDNNLEIAKYRKAIKNLEAINKNYQDIIDNQENLLTSYYQNMFDILNTLISKRVF